MKPSRLSVQNFRSLADVTVKIPDLTVMIGPNGSGKMHPAGSFSASAVRRSQQELGSYLEGRGGVLAGLSKEAVEREKDG